MLFRDEERQRGQRIGAVVDRVREQSDRPARKRDDQLHGRGKTEGPERERDHSHATCARLEGTVGLFGGAVTMAEQPGDQSVSSVVTSVVTAVVVIVVIVVLITTGGQIKNMFSDIPCTVAWGNPAC